MGESFRVERVHKICARICARAVEYTDKIGTRPNPTAHARQNRFRLFIKPLLILFILLSNLLIINLLPRILVFFLPHFLN